MSTQQPIKQRNTKQIRQKNFKKKSTQSTNTATHLLPSQVPREIMAPKGNNYSGPVHFRNKRGKKTNQSAVKGGSENKLAIRRELGKGDRGAIIINQSLHAVSRRRVPDSAQPIIAARHYH